MTTDRPGAREAVYERKVDGFGTFRVLPVVPEADADLIHRWTRQERARFWGMRDADRERILEIYAYLDAGPTHHAYLVHCDDRPAALFQTYEPQADPVGRCYDVRPGDVGVHLLVGPPDEGTRPGFTGVLVSVFLSHVLADPSRQRVVVEPDARNDKALARLVRAGFVPGPEITLPEKTARLAFLTREVFELRLR